MHSLTWTCCPVTVGEVDEGGGGERGGEERESYERSLATNSANCPLGPANLGPNIDSDRAMPLDFIIQFKLSRWFNQFSEVLKLFKKCFGKLTILTELVNVPMCVLVGGTLVTTDS